MEQYTLVNGVQCSCYSASVPANAYFLVLGAHEHLQLVVQVTINVLCKYIYYSFVGSTKKHSFMNRQIAN